MRLVPDPQGPSRTLSKFREVHQEWPALLVPSRVRLERRLARRMASRAGRDQGFGADGLGEIAVGELCGQGLAEVMLELHAGVFVAELSR